MQLLAGWALVTWALADAARWASAVAGVPTGALEAAVWAASGGVLVLGLVGRAMLGKLFGYGPYLLEELDRERRER